MFEAKVYNDVRKTIGLANCAYGVLSILLLYFFVLTPAHRQLFDAASLKTKIPEPLVALIGVAFVTALWTYVSTAILRLHDRLFEPLLVDWRRYYESDFILRSLCFDSAAMIAPRAFEEAFESKRTRATMMQRLFYEFVGDHVDKHAGLRDRFYSHIRNYWIIGLGDVYCLLIGSFTAVYSLITGFGGSQVTMVLGACVFGSAVLRIASWRYLAGVRAITAEQVSAVLNDHKDDFGKALEKLIAELGVKR